ncbi:nucleotide exchange factor GrpE [bacterium]|nr:nucleotide exchange factor GrpE [bacterium]
MTEEEKKYSEELEKNGEGAIDVNDDNLTDAGNALQAFANELGEHEKSKKKKFFNKFGGKGEGKALKEVKELEEKVAKLEEQLKLKDEKIAELEGNVKSLVAENRNQKTRIENEFRSKIKFAVEDFFKEFITVKDDFDKAMEFIPKSEEAENDPFIQGIRHLAAKFENVCSKHGLVCISSIGEKFDPAIHQAMSMINVDGKEANEIVAEYVKCYKLHDRVIRPAMVVVASGMPATKPEEPKAEEPVESSEPAEADENKAEEQPETTAENTENVSETAENAEENGNC